MNLNNVKFGVITAYCKMLTLEGATLTVTVGEGKKAVHHQCYIRNGAFYQVRPGAFAVHFDKDRPMSRLPRVGDQVAFVEESDDRRDQRMAKIKRGAFGEIKRIDSVLGKARTEIIALGLEEFWMQAQVEMDLRPVFQLFEPGASKDPIFEGTLEQLLVMRDNRLWSLDVEIKVRGRGGIRFHHSRIDPRWEYLRRECGLIGKKRKVAVDLLPQERY